MQPEYLLAGLFLFGNGLTDLVRREITLWYSGAFLGVGAAYACITGRPWQEIVPALLPGLLLFVFSLLSHGQIGGGDGIAAGILGIFLDVRGVLLSCMLGFALAGVAAGLHFLSRRRGRDAIPFLPFLLAGCLLAGRWLI